MAPPLSGVRKRNDVVRVSDSSVSYRVHQFERKPAGRANAAAGGERSAKHGGAVGQFTVRCKAGNDRVRNKDGGHGTLLIEAAFAAFFDPRAQYQRIPMIAHVVERPQLRSNRLVAHLFGGGDVVSLYLAVGVVGTDADPDL